MENKNSISSKSSITGSVTGSSTIYLKKSELPKEVSAFKNDVGYISTSTLSDWLKRNSFLQKNDVEDLIKQANLVVVDNINKELDESGLYRLEKLIEGTKKEIESIKEHLNGIDKSIMVLKDAVTTGDTYATEKWVNEQNYINESSLNSFLKGYVKSSKVYDKTYIDKNFIDVNEIKDYIKIDSIQNSYLTKKDIQTSYLTKSDAAKTYLTKEDYRGLKSAATVSDAYINKTIYDLETDLNNGVSLIDGFYITYEINDKGEYLEVIAIVKNNDIKGFQGSGSMVWKEEY